MAKTSEKTSTWFALRNAIFRRLWLAMVISGSCIGAHNTAVYWALHSLGAKTVLISLMATVSALPYTLFTLPAGALADMVDRKRILLGVQLWHALLAIALAILWMLHLLNPYIILASAFLFSTGFAFGSPAHSSVVAEMVSAEELGSAYTLAGLQMDVSGIIGPLFSALLLPLAGVSFIFGANGLGFILMFLAILQWKRPKTQSSLPLENFFESLTTAIRYVRYSPGIKVLLARHAFFSFFISIIPSFDAGYRLDGTASSGCSPRIFIYEPSRRLGRQRRVHHSVGARQVFAPTHYDHRRFRGVFNLLSDGYSPSTISWKQHLLQSERMTKNEKEVIDNLRALRTDPNPPEEWISLSVEKEVLNKRVRT
jgi:MFS family permease